MARCEECIHFEVCDALERCNGVPKISSYECGCYKNVADVVPKSEVEKLKNELAIWKQDRFNLYQRLELYEMTRQKVAKEIFAEIEELAKTYTFPVVKNGVVEIAKEPFWCFEPNDLAELKKKYTEGDEGK